MCNSALGLQMHLRLNYLSVKQIFLVSTSGNVWRAVWRISKLMLGAKGLIRAPQNKGIVKKKTKKQVPIYAIMDHNCTKTCSKMLLTLISVGKHILNLT